ncbi:MAG TPA: hypothetical protein VFZ93_10680 [Albitalea sp.]
MFASLTRAVREEAMPEEVRTKAFAALEELAAHWRMPHFATSLAGFTALAKENDDLRSAVQRFLPCLQASATQVQ